MQLLESPDPFSLAAADREVDTDMNNIKAFHLYYALSTSSTSEVQLPAYISIFISSMMHYSIALGLALASLAAAIPAPVPQDPIAPEQTDPWAGVIDPWGEYGRKPDNVKRANIEAIKGGYHIGELKISDEEVREHAKRSSVTDYAGKIPGCDYDPSDPSIPKPGWAVNQGVRIPKDGERDNCDNKQSGADHCWTEYRLVEAAIEYFSWQKSGSAVNCPADPGSSCSVAVTGLTQTCSTTGTVETNGWDFKILERSLTVGLAPAGSSLKADLGFSQGISHNWANSEYKLRQTCTTESSAVTCTWVNPDSTPKNLCHQIWYADRVAHVWGQAQRTCAKCSNGNVQQNAGDGNVCVRGQMEFDFRIPLNKLIHCDGRCDSEDPGLNMPPNGERRAYQDVTDWNLNPLRNKLPGE
ncbi:hypothetical protein FHETE_4194 [Fusarium heterosporum]|uniref:Uncharacterized protein n=1 Tax=Fusarium heterosporum TaxID=42747 RepID=A0A8H5WV48_FUSHE|nr:hypothetical protein FHETE_4194 [Fusarium heterosporum]